MKKACSALCSQYVIDGIRRELSPAQLLGAETSCPSRRPDPIVDESVDPSPVPVKPDDGGTDTYLHKVLSLDNFPFPTVFASGYTRSAVGAALTETLWRKGSFRLGDIRLNLSWKWNDSVIGNMSAFYASAEAAAEMAEELGISTGDISFTENERLSLEVTPALRKACGENDDELLEEFPYHSHNPHMEEGRMIPAELEYDPQSWVIYIPFDTCPFRLGGSRLAHIMGSDSSGAPVLPEDSDYFLDCFEIVREMVEDKVLVSGASVWAGGLMTALKEMCSECGIEADISEIMRSRQENSASAVLFGEIPGALVQIKDIDYDYFDAQMLLQDIVYFPIGHPDSDRGSVRISSCSRNGIYRILESIMNSQSSEGED